MSVLVLLLDYLTFGDCLRQYDAFLIVLQTGEYLVRISVEQSYECHPFLFVVLETHNVALQFLRSNLNYFRISARAVVVFVVLLVLARYRNHDTCTAAVAIDGASFAARTPCLYIQTVDKFFIDIVRQVHGHADAVVNPLLDRALHLDLHQPVNVVGCSLIIRRLDHKLVYFFLGVALLCVISVHLHPLEELSVIYNVFLERISHLVNKVDMHFRVVGVNLAATLVNRHEHRFYTTCCLCHQTGGTCRSDGKTRDVAASVCHDVVIQLRIYFLYTEEERVVFLA